MAAASRFLGLLRVLVEHEVDFLVVGGVAAILEGAPISTFDLDVVHRRSSDNVQRLLTALLSINAHYQDPAGRHFKPDVAKLSTPGHHQLLTDLGPLDVLGTVGSGQSYKDLFDRCHVYALENMEIRVLSLAAVIESKEAANRDKDRAALPALYRTLALQGQE